jgi:hypothetical protein
VRVDVNSVAAVVMGVMVGGDENEASASDPVGNGSATVEVHSNVGGVAEFNGAAADEKDDVLIVPNGVDGMGGGDIDDVDANETDVYADADVDTDDTNVEADKRDQRLMKSTDVLVDEMVGIIIGEGDDIAAEIDERPPYIAAAGCKNVRKRTTDMVQKTGGAAGKTVNIVSIYTQC